MMQSCEQLSFFSMPLQAGRTAICCMDGQSKDATPAESWMRDLFHGAEYTVYVAGHPLVLKPVPGTPDSIQSGHEYSTTTPSARACTRGRLSGGCGIEKP